MKKWIFAPYYAYKSFHQEKDPMWILWLGIFPGLFLLLGILMAPRLGWLLGSFMGLVTLYGISWFWIVDPDEEGM